MVFDELEVKKVVVPFRWQDELDVSWCSHPNWYWVWSKYSLPHLHHPVTGFSRLSQPFSLLHRFGDRLFHQHMHAVLQAAHGQVKVLRRGRGDGDRIHPV